MNIRMSLFSEEFYKINSGEKSIEVRCNDLKRRRIKVGDKIEFKKLPDCKEVIVVKVVELYPCNSFRELYSKVDFEEFGCEGYTMERMIEETRTIYSEEKEKKWGALGIRVKINL